MVRFGYLLKGVVQGVGFRPFVFKTAGGLGLNGFVKNTPEGVVIEVEGEKEQVETFEKALEIDLPPLAKIDTIVKRELPAILQHGFEILKSAAGDLKTSPVAPDIKVCSRCIEDIRDPKSRYYGYFATNCTDCGPRYSIVKTVPYDRQNTSMAEFTMCEECRKEYEDPFHRRFHAQPVACPACGPKLGVDLKEAAKAIKSGKIVAVKGIGGFHIVCDALNSETIEKLREFKNRPTKPFAVMCKNIEQVKNLACVTKKEEELLTSKEAPIVILKKLPATRYPLPAEIAPAIDRIGCMLAYTPLHYLLFDHLENPIVATSANLGEEPIITTKEEIERKLPFVDLVVDFNRDIVNGIDDSLVQVVGGKTQILRLARGYAPKTIKLPKKIDRKILAVGGNQKNTIALAFHDTLILSPHIGDLGNVEASLFFERTVDSFKRFYDYEPDRIVCDKHPNYETTKWAKKQGVEVVEVQHHLAHIYSVKAEFGLKRECIGFSFDGTGYGDEKINGKAREGALGYDTLWGGEIFAGDKRKYRFKPIKLLGGEKAIKEPRRVALSMLFERYSLDEVLRLNLEAVKSFKESEIKILYQSYIKGLNAIASSSVGRLFDAVASIANLCHFQSYEGEAGLLCEGAYREEVTKTFDYEINQGNIEIAFDFFEEDFVSVFINTLVEIIADFAIKAKRDVILTGGVFQNRTLLTLAEKRLEEEGIRCFTNREIPVNDGGISVGQIYCAL